MGINSRLSTPEAGRGRHVSPKPLPARRAYRPEGRLYEPEAHRKSRHAGKDQNFQE